MSKKQNKKYFNAPSQLSDKYYQNLKQGPSDETTEPSPNLSNMRDYGATDEGAPDEDTLGSGPKKWKLPEWIENGLKWVAILVAILWYFWCLNGSVNEIKTKTDSLDGKMFNLESKIDNTAKELTSGQNDIKVVLERIIGKIDRLFDKTPTSQKEVP